MNSVEELNRRFEELNLKCNTLRTLKSVGGYEDVVQVIARQKPTTAAASGILEYDRKGSSPFFENSEHWKKLVKDKEDTLNREFQNSVKKRFCESQVCKVLLEVPPSPIELRKALMNMAHLQNPPPVGDKARFEYHNELYLLDLVKSLLVFEEQGVYNPLSDLNEIHEGWLGAHLHSAWADACFWNCGDLTAVYRSEVQSASSLVRKKLQQQQQQQQGSKDNREQSRISGAKVDMMVSLKGIQMRHRVEALFLEAKRRYPWDSNSVSEDRIKLQKEMNDALTALTNELRKMYHPKIMFFGIQTVGLDCKLYALDSTIHHLADFSELYSFTFPKEVSKDLKTVLMAGCVMLEVKQRIKEFDQKVRELQEDIKGWGDGDRSSNHDDDDKEADSDGNDDKQDRRPKGSDSASKSGWFQVSFSGSAATPTKKGNNKGTQPTDSIEVDLKSDSISPQPPSRNGQPWFVEYAVLKSNGTQVAVKNLRRGWGLKGQMVREATLLSLANSLGVRHVVPLLSAYEPQLNPIRLEFSMVFPRLLPINDSTIHSHSLEDVQRIAGQLNTALSDLHQVRILHLDVSTSNVMLDPATMEVRLIDFGHAELMYPGFVFEYDCGTVGYRAPEVQAGEAVNVKCDVYSAGVVLLHLLIPFLFSNETGEAEGQSEVEIHLSDWRDNRIRERMVQIVRRRAKQVLECGSTNALLQELCTAAVNQTRYDTQKRCLYYYGSKSQTIPRNPHLNQEEEEEEEEEERSHLSQITNNNIRTNNANNVKTDLKVSKQTIVTSLNNSEKENAFEVEV